MRSVAFDVHGVEALEVSHVSREYRHAERTGNAANPDIGGEIVMGLAPGTGVRLDTRNVIYVFGSERPHVERPERDERFGFGRIAGQ